MLPHQVCCRSGNIIRLSINSIFVFLSFYTRWDNGDFDRLSPWDLENIDPRRKPLSVGASVRVLPIEIIMTSYMPGIDDWPPVGDRDCESDRISAGISQVMALDIAQPFSAPVDLDKFPTYAYVVKFPMDLCTIKTRLDNRFYRRAAAVEYDVRRIQTNALLFNDPTKSNIVRNSCIITDLCLEIIRKGDADIANLSDQLLERCKMKEISGNVQSSAELNQTSVPAQVRGQQFIHKANQVAKEQWPTEASSISLKGHISPKLSQFVNVDGSKIGNCLKRHSLHNKMIKFDNLLAGIDLTVDDQKSDDDSERENTHFAEITTSRIKKKFVDPEEVKVECPAKLKQTALVSPYTFSRHNESLTINSQEKDMSTRVEDHAPSTARNTSRRSRLPIQGVKTENLDAILFPESTPSLFSTVSPSVNTAIGVFHGPKNSDTGIEVRTPPIDKSYFQLPTLNTPLELIGIRKQEHPSNTFSSTSIRPIPVPLAVSTPIRMRNKEDDSITNFAFGKPRLPRNGRENEIDGQSVSCSPSLVNHYCGKIRKKRQLSRLSVWNISLVEHVAQGSSGQNSPILQEQSSQPSHPNQLPLFEMVTKDCPLLLKPSNKIIGDALRPDCGIHANIYEPPEVQTASPTTIQDKSLFSVITDVPTPVEWALDETHEANHQLDCRYKSVFKAKRNQTHSAAKDKSLTKGKNQPDHESNPTSSNCFPFRYEECKAPDSLLKKTLKKEHQVKCSTYKISSGSKKHNSCEQADDNPTDTTVLKDSSDPVLLSQDVLFAEILAESNLHVPIDKLDGKSESKQRKGKIAGLSALSKVKKTRKRPSDVCVSVEEIMKKYLPSEGSHRQCDDSKKKKHPKVHKKKRSDKLVSKGAMEYQHDVRIDNDICAIHF